MKCDPDQFTAVLGKYVYRSAYTPGQLASLTGVPKMTLVNWLNGRVKRPRGWQRVVAVAVALRLTESETDELLAAAAQSTIQELRGRVTDESEQERLAFWQTAVPIAPPFQAVALPPYFVGREAERATLGAGLREETQTAVYCLHGMAGVGKTSLAAQIAYDLRQHFADGVLWARLDSSDTLSILAAFAQAYQRDVSHCLDVASRSGVVRDLLSSRQVLIVLDNAETSEQIEPLLPPTGNCAVLVTTRRQDLAVLVGAKRVELRPFSPDAATSLALFAQILGEERVQMEADLLTEMATELGHLPLALVIAASRLAYEPGWQTAQFGERLRQVSQRLQALRYETQNVRRSFQVSYDWLDDEARQLFIAAGKLGRQEFSAAAVVALTLLAEEGVADGLRRLFSLSLVQGGTDGRYVLHPLLHDFAQSLETTEPMAERLVSYWLSFVSKHRYEPEMIVREMGHVEVAAQMAMQMVGKDGMKRPLRQLLDALMPTLLTRGAHLLAEKYLTQAQAVLVEDQVHFAEGQSWLLLRRGQLERERHHLETAEQQLTAGLQLARQQKDAGLEAQLLTELGIVYNCMGQMARSKSFLLEAMPLARLATVAAGDSLLNILEELGILALMEDDGERAKSYYQEGYALAEARGNGAQRVMFLKSLGALAHVDGEADEAKRLFERGFGLAQQLQFHKGMMALGNNLGVVCFNAGEMKMAVEMLQVAYDEAVRLDDENGQILIGLNLAYWGRFNGRFSHARHYFSQVLAGVEEQGHGGSIEQVKMMLVGLSELEGKRPFPPASEHLKVFI